ncbi:MAG: hypothetical protein R3F13_12560 [Prosthecobacter sp.]
MKTLILPIVALTLISTATAPAQQPKENPQKAIEELQERSRDAKAEGRLDEARERAGRAERLRSEHEGMKRPARPFEKGGPKPERPPEAERMEHVMQAIQHLHAAGLHEPAKGIEEIAQHMRREMEERMRHEHAEARERDGRHAELEEMRQQMRRMAEQIEKLQAELKKRGE